MADPFNAPVQGGSTAMEELVEILDLERIEHNLYRGLSPQVGWQRVFGGQVIAQALVAAQRTVDEALQAHSLHCYFILAGDPSVPIIYEVDRIRDGKSFATRRVVAIQHGRAIFSLSASFQRIEDGLTHAFGMPEDAPDPETLMSEKDLVARFIDHVPEGVRKYWTRERAIEMRPVSLTHYISKEKLPPRQQTWIRARGTPPQSAALRLAILAYFSDMTLLDTALYAHGRSIFDPDLQVASLDHAMWFHAVPTFGDWMLYSQDSPASGGSRGLARGFIHARDGTLLASVAQEGLIRQRRKMDD